MPLDPAQIDYVAKALCRCFYGKGTIYEEPIEFVIEQRWPEWRGRAEAAIKAVYEWDNTLDERLKDLSTDHLEARVNMRRLILALDVKNADEILDQYYTTITLAEHEATRWALMSGSYTSTYGPEDLTKFPWDKKLGGWFCASCNAPWQRGHYDHCTAASVCREKSIITDPKGILRRSQADIYAPEDERVTFAYPDAGYQHDQDTAADHLTLGDTYTIERTEVGDWYTDYFLKEVPGVSFNSVHFAPAPTSPECTS